MIFGFGKKEDNEPTIDEEYEFVKFKGATNDKNPNLSQAQRLVDVGLIPAKELITDALLRRAEMMRIDPKGAQSQLTLYIDGLPYSGGRLGKQEANAITQMLKMLAGLNVKVRDKKQASGLRAELEGFKYLLDIAVTPTASGERLVIRVQDLSYNLITLEDMGGSEDLKLKLREVLSSNGFLGVVGPPNSGTTTTTQGVMRGLDPYLNQMFSMGDIGREELPNITAFEFNPGETLKEAMTRCFRQEADIIYLNKLTDAETTNTFLNFHNEGKLVSEFAAANAAAGLVQLVEWTQNPQLVVDSVRGVMSQLLIRRLCDSCKQVFRPNPTFLAKAGLPKDLTQLCRRAPQGEEFDPCDDCDALGFQGRVALFELIEMSDGMKKVILNTPTTEAIRAQAKKEGMHGLQQDGLRLVAEGVTSLDELQRAFRARR